MARPSGSSSRRLLRRRSLLEEKQWTLLEEWAYVIPYGSSTARNELLPAYLRIYNGRKCHMALGGLTPQQRLDQLLA
jgi:hypothetical protein